MIMATKKKVDEVVGSNRVFRDDKHALLTIAIVVLVALVAFNFEGITGNAVTEPASLSVFQEGKIVTVQMNYPNGEYGRSNNLIDMRAKIGSRRVSSNSECDLDRGYVARGNSKCVREIAEFDIRGTTWKSGDLVVFSVRGTDISRDYRIQ